jgi:hypothetical protein
MKSSEGNNFWVVISNKFLSFSKGADLQRDVNGNYKPNQASCYNKVP